MFIVAFGVGYAQPRQNIDYGLGSGCGGGGERGLVVYGERALRARYA
jgi:hypothetical protein